MFNLTGLKNRIKGIEKLITFQVFKEIFVVLILMLNFVSIENCEILD